MLKEKFLKRLNKKEVNKWKNNILNSQNSEWIFETFPKKANGKSLRYLRYGARKI
jgi:hypothetical protein